jgi:hypothetical protein
MTTRSKPSNGRMRIPTSVVLRPWLAGDELQAFIDRYAITEWPKRGTVYLVLEEHFFEDGTHEPKGFRKRAHAELYADSIFGNVEHRIVTVTATTFVPARALGIAGIEMAAKASARVRSRAKKN